LCHESAPRLQPAATRIDSTDDGALHKVGFERLIEPYAVQMLPLI